MLALGRGGREEGLTYRHEARHGSPASLGAWEYIGIKPPNHSSRGRRKDAREETEDNEGSEVGSKRTRHGEGGVPGEGG